ncbi:hypothetical protein JCM1393_21260 [Clostridium carnis]
MELFTVKEVAQKLKTTKNVVYDLLRANHIQGLKLGNIKITSVELERFILEAEGKDFSNLNDIREFSLRG